MPCENCNCGRKSKEVTPSFEEARQALAQARELTCEEEYEEWLERAERLGIRLIEEPESIYENND